jgi:esterase/lipase/carbon monoxide dehydrogenase subunit G
MMIDINEKFTVAAPPSEVYAVLSDPNAVVECVAGAELGQRNDDGSYDGTMTVKFSALRVAFKGKVNLDLNKEERAGFLQARGRDNQGGTKFQATATFRVDPLDDGAASQVTASGEVELSGKLASVIEGAAGAVVRRMTGDFVEALSRRCASGTAQLGPAETPAEPAVETPATAAPAPVPVSAPEPTVGVLLLHDFGGSPATMRAWGESLAGGGFTVTIPRLPGHGTRWADLNSTTWLDWADSANAELTALRAKVDRVYVMGLSLGASLALRLAQQRPADVAGLVLVNPPATGPVGRRAWLRVFLRSRPAVVNDAKKAGVTDVSYAKVPLRAAASARELCARVAAGLGTVTQPVLLVTSAEDHVVPTADSDAIWERLTNAERERLVLPDSFHLAPLDNDAALLFERSRGFVRDHAVGA